MRARAAAALVLCAALGACKDRRPPPVAPSPADGGADVPPGPAAARPERVVLEGVVVKTIDPERDREREVYPRELGRQLGQILTASDWFVVAADAVPPGHRARPARLEVTLTYDQIAEGSQGGPALVAAAEARLLWIGDRDGLTIAENVLAERPLAAGERANLDGLIAELVGRVVAQAGAGVIAKEALRSGPDDAVVAALRDGDADTRLWALAVAAERRLDAGFDAVVELLGARDEAVRDAAIGALVALRDPRAIEALTAMADFQDYGLMRRILEAVAAIGGEDAAVYLEFVATGHPDPGIRDQAGTGLARLRRRHAER